AEALGVVDRGSEPDVHRGALEQAPWSKQVCFAGLGPGEVRIGGQKVVGLSQRRTRAGARFQALVLAAWDPEPLLALLALTTAERRAAADATAPVASGVGADALPRL